jgi:hypothetical protein
MRQWEDGSKAQATAGLSKAQVGKIIGVVLTAVIALLAVFGYQVVVVNPTVAGIATEMHEVRQAVGAGVTLDGATLAGVAAQSGGLPGVEGASAAGGSLGFDRASGSAGSAPCPCATAAP